MKDLQYPGKSFTMWMALGVLLLTFIAFLFPIEYAQVVIRICAVILDLIAAYMITWIVIKGKARDSMLIIVEIVITMALVTTICFMNPFQ